jgi:DedD protein
MPVLSILRRKDPKAAASAADDAPSVQAARSRARRRLIGAAVLVGIGIIGFPLLFETQPRPIAVDIPIEIPARDSVAPLALPAPAGASAARVTGAVITERAAEAPATPAPAASRATAAASAAPATAPLAAPPLAAAPERPPTARAQPRPTDEAEARRALALLEGKPAPPNPAPTPDASADAKGERFIVQAGAYGDPNALREARQKVEKLGLKTYTQVVQTEAGPRTRVRVGPYATRDEAEKAAARIKASGLAASVLSL